MHILQEKLISLAQKHNLQSMSLRQIGKLIDEEHPQKIKHHLKQLERSGFFKFTNKKKGVTNYTKLKGSVRSDRDFVSIPLLGLANCGNPNAVAEEKIASYLTVSKGLLSSHNKSNLFAVRAIGSSMNKSNINGKTVNEGDYVVIDGGDRCALDGDYVLSVINGMANIKKVSVDRQNHQIVLSSESTGYFPPIHIHEDHFSEYMINGKVVGVLKEPKNDSLHYSPLIE